MTSRLVAALDDCLQAMEAGASLEAALARHPALADELRPMLLAAQAARPGDLIRVPRQSEDASRARFLARARVLRQSPRRTPFGFFPKLSLAAVRVLALLLVLLAGGVLGTAGIGAAAAQSLPGDLLYTVKRSAEQVQLVLAPDPATRTALEVEFDLRRLEEARATLEQGRTAEIEFSGRVEQQVEDRWVVAGLTVTVPGDMGAGIGLGQRVRVFGTAQADGSILASRIVTSETLPTVTATATQTATLTRTPTPQSTARYVASAEPEETEKPDDDPPTATRTATRQAPVPRPLNPSRRLRRRRRT
jgi:hypothetical protein